MPPEELQQQPRTKVKASIYLLPNLITAASLFFGFLAIKYSIDARLLNDPHKYVEAAQAILLAGVCDGLDGSIARLTRTQSAFGVQLDSLCDMVSFGLAPAVLAYNFGLYNFVRLGFCVSFIYIVCGALRLARFNVQSTFGRTNGNFTGIPIPMAAAPVAVYIMAQVELSTWKAHNHPAWEMVMANYLTEPLIRSGILLTVMFLLALGMISTFEYYSHKAIKLPKKRPFRVFAGIVILSALFMNLQFVLSLSVLLFIYCLHGPVLWIFTRKDRASEEEELFEPENND